MLRDNAARLEVAEQLDVRCVDLLQDGSEAAAVCDVVVMNPPFGTRNKVASRVQCLRAH